MAELKFPHATDKKVSMEMQRAYSLKKDLKNKLVESSLLNVEQKGFLIPDEGEKTLKIPQKQIISLVPRAIQLASYNIDLDHGPYQIDISKNGKHLLIGGAKGHIAMFDWMERKLTCEFSINEKVNDICLLHNETMFAVAQKKHLYFYDKNGIEIHAMRNHGDPQFLEFLPYHFSLVSLSKYGVLKYLDITNGKIEKEIKARPSTSMWQSYNNAVIHNGYSNGQVALFVPNIAKPVVKFLAHSTPVLSGASDRNYIVTSGLDSKIKVWDVRTYKMVYEYYSPQPSKSISISQRGLLAFSSGNIVICWKDWQMQKQKEPYMKTKAASNIAEIKFARYEDFILSGNEKGISTNIIPGSGEPNFDSNEDNIFESKKQRQMAEVHKLLEKLPLDTITLTSRIGDIDPSLKNEIEEGKQKEVTEKELVRKRNAKTEKAKDRFELEKIRSKNKEIVERKMEMKKKEQRIAIEEEMALSMVNDIDPTQYLKKKKTE